MKKTVKQAMQQNVRAAVVAKQQFDVPVWAIKIALAAVAVTMYCITMPLP